MLMGAMNIHERFMQRALLLAERGAGFVYRENPLVGAVVVREDEIIAEGFHQRYGGPHAEVCALDAAGKEAKGADLYVTLEPCVHHDKKTPPCADKIIRSGIRRVFIAMRDPNPKVKGRGVQKLKRAKIEVMEGILEKQARKLNEIYIKYITTGRPFVLLKMAMSADGKIATVSGDSKWISGEESLELAHELRNRFMAVLVGINTVLKDDPHLNTRLNKEARDPIRIILDSKGRIPLDARVLHTKSPAKTVIATTGAISKEKWAQLRQLGAEIWKLPAKEHKVDLRALIAKLASEKIDSLLIEGGPIVAASFLKEGLIDKVLFVIAPKILGGKEAPSPIGGTGFRTIRQAIQLRDVSVRMLGKDVIYEGYLKKRRRVIFDDPPSALLSSSPNPIPSSPGGSDDRAYMPRSLGFHLGSILAVSVLLV